MALAGAKRSNIPTTIEQIKKRSKACGRHFFDPSTMRFFNSRIAPGVAVGSNAAYFITSEQFVHWRTGEKDRKLYTVRKTKNGCEIDTVGEFQAYKTLASARKAAKQLAKTGRVTASRKRKK